MDSGPLGRLCRPNGRSPDNREIAFWFTRIVRRSADIIIPEVADFEVRRELIRSGLTQSIQRLDLLKGQLVFLPVDSQAFLRAAELWATARNLGTPTADPRELDCDVILAAQAQLAGAIVVTENVGHLSRFVTAVHWRDLG